MPLKHKQICPENQKPKTHLNKQKMPLTNTETQNLQKTLPNNKASKQCKKKYSLIVQKMHLTNKQTIHILLSL